MIASLQPIIWPLAAKRLCPQFMQQSPRAYAGGVRPKMPVNLPWNAASSRFGIVDSRSLPIPGVVHQMMPVSITQYGFIGISRDSAGVPLGGCTVKLYRESDDAMVDVTISDANGDFRFKSASQVGVTYYVRWYLAGSPDRAGTSLNGLVPG